MTDHRWTEDDYGVMALAAKDENGLVHSPPGDSAGAVGHREAMERRVGKGAFIKATEPLAPGASATWQITKEGLALLKAHQEEKTRGDR